MGISGPSGLCRMIPMHHYLISHVSGLHFNMSEGRPVSMDCDVSSLIGSDGMFLGKQGTLAAAMEGRLQADHVKTITLTGESYNLCISPVISSDKTKIAVFSILYLR